ncbi:hypothetical protein CC86DRAFT_379817 [Ophiobolus disseminans]|uniref:Uncharacterized protein n=1 Tax=Ophiobolus disseminans TaxID=1469910 RepID=A0A6A7A796_9PLEO|nr:hypothetical protein CC86DRAFT_379817 [Ophiobolus disseminans]
MPAPSVLRVPLLINPISGQVAETVENAYSLWKAAAEFLKTVEDTTNILDGRITRMKLVTFWATHTFESAKKTHPGTCTRDIHAAIWEKLEEEKRKLAAGDTTGTSETDREDLVKELIALAKKQGWDSA